MKKEKSPRLLAELSGSKTYFSTPCKKHPELQGERLTGAGNCVQCKRDDTKKRYWENVEKRRQWAREYYQAHKKESHERYMRKKLAGVK